MAQAAFRILNGRYPQTGKTPIAKRTLDFPNISLVLREKGWAVASQFQP
jgi:hypothetical protein